MSATSACSLERSSSECSSTEPLNPSYIWEWSYQREQNPSFLIKLCARSQSCCFLDDFHRNWILSSQPSADTCFSQQQVSSPLGWTDIIKGQILKARKCLKLETCWGNWVKAPNTGLGLRRPFGLGLTIFFLSCPVNYYRGFVTQLYLLMKWMFPLSNLLLNKPHTSGRNKGFIRNIYSQEKYIPFLAHWKNSPKYSSHRPAKSGKACWEKNLTALLLPNI